MNYKLLITAMFFSAAQSYGSGSPVGVWTKGCESWGTPEKGGSYQIFLNISDASHASVTQIQYDEPNCISKKKLKNINPLSIEVSNDQISIGLPSIQNLTAYLQEYVGALNSNRTGGFDDWSIGIEKQLPVGPRPMRDGTIYPADYGFFYSLTASFKVAEDRLIIKNYFDRCSECYTKTVFNH